MVFGGARRYHVRRAHLFVPLPLDSSGGLAGVLERAVVSVTTR